MILYTHFFLSELGPQPRKKSWSDLKESTMQCRENGQRTHENGKIEKLKGQKADLQHCLAGSW